MNNVFHEKPSNLHWFDSGQFTCPCGSNVPVHLSYLPSLLKFTLPQNKKLTFLLQQSKLSHLYW